MNEALRYFDVKTRRKLPDAQQTSQTTQPGRVADLEVTDTESQADESLREDRDINEELISAEDESEGSTNKEQSNDHKPVMPTGDSARLREPMLSPAEEFHIEQRSRVGDSQTGQIAQSVHSLSPNMSARAGKFKTGNCSAI